MDIIPTIVDIDIVCGCIEVKYRALGRLRKSVSIPIGGRAGMKEFKAASLVKEAKEPSVVVTTEVLTEAVVEMCTGEDGIL